MFEYRAVLVRLRQGDSDRDIARARLMGRPKVAAVRALALREGWLATDTPLPEDAVIAAAIGHARRAHSTISSVERLFASLGNPAQDVVTGIAKPELLEAQRARVAPDQAAARQVSR
jgi:hypothetical protein